MTPETLDTQNTVSENDLFAGIETNDALDEAKNRADIAVIEEARDNERQLQQEVQQSVA